MENFKLNKAISIVGIRAISIADVKDKLIEFNFELENELHLIPLSEVLAIADKLIDFHSSIPLAEDGEISWDKIPVGTLFAAQINDSDLIKGTIQKEGKEIYLCQNGMDGADCRDKLGYSYSWSIGTGILSRLGGNDVNIIELGDDITISSYNKDKYLGEIENYSTFIYNGFIQIGCQSISNTKLRELIKFIESSNIKE